MAEVKGRIESHRAESGGDVVIGAYLCGSSGRVVNLDEGLFNENGVYRMNWSGCSRFVEVRKVPTEPKA